jgi:tetratricopeptide (TPR) repeat protein
MAKKTVCLVMIVKNEAHVITNTLRQLVQFIPFDYWCISDTGSTDTTKKDITTFFKKRGIPGEIYDTEWRDFGYNRTVAFQKAYKKTDYAFVWDADDEICGNFVFPKNLEADSYKFMFGNSNGLRYERVQLFNNYKRWEYVGVLHEYPRCMEDAGPNFEVFGDYYFVSGRSGARNKNPNKYQDDARILEKAYKEAREKNDEIYKRYAFYCAQSYSSAKMDEKAIEHYKNVLTIDTWLQEKYMSCLSIYESYEKLGREQEGLFYLLESYKYDPKRIECIYRLIKYHCIHGPWEASFLYYGLIQSYYENEYPTETFSNKLFVNKEDYDFYLPYYMTITADRVKRPEISAKMFDYIFKYKYTGASQWWIDNLFSNLQFLLTWFPTRLSFSKIHLITSTFYETRILFLMRSVMEFFYV